MNRHVQPEDSDLYALGALDGEEKQTLEAHLRECAECAREVEAARQRVALLALAAPAQAPLARVKEEFLRKVRTERGSGNPEGRGAKRGFGFGWLTPVLGLATVAFAGVAVMFWMRDARDVERIRALEGQLAQVQTQSREMARASATTDKLLEMPGTMRVALMPQPGMPPGRGGLLYNAKMGMVACTGWLPPAPKGKSYQLWLVPMEGKPMPLGVWGDEWTAPMTMHVTPGMEAKAFAITEEPEGGMPGPTGPKVLVVVGE